MTRRDWWIGVVVLAFAVLVHALVPRYDWRQVAGEGGLTFMRTDRWTGAAAVVAKGGQWTDVDPH